MTDHLIHETFRDRIGVECGVAIFENPGDVKFPFRVTRSKTGPEVPSDPNASACWMKWCRNIDEAYETVEEYKGNDYDTDFWADERYCVDDEERRDAGWI